MKGMFFIKGVSAWINPMQVASVYQSMGTWRAALANGREYPLTEEEYSELIEAYKPEEKKEVNEEEIRQKLVDMLLKDVAEVTEGIRKSLAERFAK